MELRKAVAGACRHCGVLRGCSRLSLQPLGLLHLLPTPGGGHSLAGVGLWAQCQGKGEATPSCRPAGRVGH